jgi:hypothetical protein
MDRCVKSGVGTKSAQGGRGRVRSLAKAPSGQADEKRDGRWRHDALVVIAYRGTHGHAPYPSIRPERRGLLGANGRGFCRIKAKLVARWYCRAAHQAFSLLPDSLAAHLSGTLEDVERVVAAVEAAPSVERAADSLRPDVELPGAVRWTRRRLAPVRTCLVTIVGLTRIGWSVRRPASRPCVADSASRACSSLCASWPVGICARCRRRSDSVPVSALGRARDLPNSERGETLRDDAATPVAHARADRVLNPQGSSDPWRTIASGYVRRSGCFATG